MNTDLISRQAAIEELSYCQTFLYDSMDKYPKIELGDAKAVLEALPAAESRTGKWKVWYHGFGEGCKFSYTCSECGFHGEGTPYCSNCGAIMETGA